MTIYNKPFLFIGFIVGAVGVYLDNTHTNMWVLAVVLMLLGAAMVIWSMKKPKNYKDPLNRSMGKA
jgi:putative Mn2+ efflux pump MntP